MFDKKILNYLPSFSTDELNNVESNLDTLLNQQRITLQELLASTLSPRDFILSLEWLLETVHRFWAPINHLNSVANSEVLRIIYQNCLPKLTDFFTEITQNKSLYDRMISIKQNHHDWNSLNAEEQRLIDLNIKDFELSGVNLPDNDKKQLATLEKKLALAMDAFSNNVLDATQHWFFYTEDKKSLTGLPEDILDKAHECAQENNQSGYRFTLDAPDYLAIMTYAQKSELRKLFYEAYTTRASDQGPNAGKWDNSKLMIDILNTREHIASLLKKNNYAEVSLATKMLNSTGKVNDFLNQLVSNIKPLAQNELETLEKFAKEMDGVKHLQPWDMLYYSEKLREAHYALSDEKLRPYFPFDAVWHGLLLLLKELYEIEFQLIPDANTWHKDASCYAIYNIDSKKMIGYIYTDVFTRKGKRGGAWMDNCYNRYQHKNRLLDLPIAFLVCNFPTPSKTKPSLLNHDEVLTLFHEMGHCLHHLLTTIDYPSINGINHVEWDAVELPSQLNEKWAWETDILKQCSEHYHTKEQLPDELITALQRNRNFHVGLHYLRQLEFSLFDMAIHTQSINNSTLIQSILNQLREKVSVIKPPKENRMQHSFSHIFAGGYAAGYYSYQWADILASHAFTVFNEKPNQRSQCGKKFREALLSKGASDSAENLFEKFTGEKPSIVPFFTEIYRSL